MTIGLAASAWRAASRCEAEAHGRCDGVVVVVAAGGATDDGDGVAADEESRLHPAAGSTDYSPNGRSADALGQTTSRKPEFGE